MKVVGITDVGLVRRKNEDNFWIDQDNGFFLVCDGMGGHRGGEVASRLAVQTIRQDFNYLDTDNVQEKLIKAIQKANQVIFEAGRANEHLYEMGTTLTASLIREFHLLAANVGDSGIFLIRNQSIRKITRDHTLAEQMLDDGMIKPEEIRDNAYNHILTRALGIEEQVDVDMFEENLLEGDMLLMCSDGLTDMLTAEEILTLIKNAAYDLDLAVNMLLNEALKKGGYDNITMVLIWLN